MVRYLTTNGKSDAYEQHNPFTLRYRRVNETFCECIKIGVLEYQRNGALKEVVHGAGCTVHGKTIMD